MSRFFYFLNPASVFSSTGGKQFGLPEEEEEEVRAAPPLS